MRPDFSPIDECLMDVARRAGRVQCLVASVSELQLESTSKNQVFGKRLISFSPARVGPYLQKRKPCQWQASRVETRPPCGACHDPEECHEKYTRLQHHLYLILSCQHGTLVYSNTAMRSSLQ